MGLELVLCGIESMFNVEGRHRLSAKVILGLMCQDGLGVPRNGKAARKWHGLAAKQGDSTAQLALARMHHEGEGGPKNFVEACKWGHISAANGNQDAWKIIDSAEKELQPLETAKALQLVLKCKTAHQDDSQLLFCTKGA